MEYRIIYDTNEVLSYVENNSETYTKTLSKVYTGTINDSISFFRKQNINYEMLINDFSIVEKELFSVEISDTVIEDISYNRKVVVIDMPIDFSSEVAYGTMKIIVDKEDEPTITNTFVINNDFYLDVDGELIGEFDFFYDLLMNQSVPLSDAITNKIKEMDSNGVFNSLTKTEPINTKK